MTFVFPLNAGGGGPGRLPQPVVMAAMVERKMTSTTEKDLPDDNLFAFISYLHSSLLRRGRNRRTPIGEDGLRD